MSTPNLVSNIWRSITKRDPAFDECDRELYERVRDYVGIAFGLAIVLSLGDLKDLTRELDRAQTVFEQFTFWASVGVRLLSVILIWFFFSRTHIILKPRASINSALGICLPLIPGLLAVIVLARIPIQDFLTNFTYNVNRELVAFLSVFFILLSALSFLGRWGGLDHRKTFLSPRESWRLMWHGISTLSIALVFFGFYVFPTSAALDLGILLILFIVMSALGGWLMPVDHGDDFAELALPPLNRTRSE